MRRHNVYLPDDVMASLREEAARQHRSISSLIVHIIRDWAAARLAA